MKILFMAPQSLTVISGGLKRQMSETATGLSSLGHRIHFLSPEKNLFEIQPDVIHFFGAQPELYYTLQFLQNHEIPTVVSPVFFSRRSASSLKRLISFQNVLSRTPLLSLTELQMRQRSCTFASHVVPNTKAEADLIHHAFGIKPSNITVIPNGADVERFTNSSPEIYESKYPWRDFILYVGDLNAERKNVLKMLYAYSTLKKNYPLLPPLVLAGTLGTTAYASQIRTYIQQHDSIQWIGPIDHHDPLLASLYRAARIFVLPSYFETPGIAAMEAALSGCEIVITPFGGTMEVFGENAFYIDPKSVRSIAKGIESALERTKQNHSTNSNPLIEHLIQNYGWAHVARQTEAVYKRLV